MHLTLLLLYRFLLAGTLIINGRVDIRGDSVLNIDIAGLDDYDLLQVLGNLDLRESCRLVIRRTSAYQDPIAGDTFTLVEWTGGRSGQFFSVSDSTNDVTYIVTYETSTLRLTVQ